MTTRHTPGPWRWWTSNSYSRLSSDATGKDGDVMRCYVSRHDGVGTIEVGEADAVLIEAAPDLLAFAEGIVRGYDHDEDAHHHNNGACRVCNAERVIAKATGSR
jgi:hypothetical protein